MLKKILTLVLTVIMIAAAAIPALAAFEPDKDPALTKYLGFENTIGDAVTLFKNAPNRTPHLDARGGNIKYSAGVYGQAFDFDGETGLYLGNDLVKGDKFTIAMWYNAREIMAWTSIFHARFLDGDDEAGNDEVWMCIRPRTDLGANPDRNMQFWTCGVGKWDYWFDGVSSVNAEPNKWYHVAVTMSGEDIVFYIDGKIAFDTRTSEANFTNNIYNLMDGMSQAAGKRFYLGLNEFQDWPFRGAIDEFYSFNRALSQAEIVDLMNYNPVPAAPAVEPPAAEEAPVPVVEEAPVVIAPPPTPKPVAAKTGDTGIIALSVVMIIASAGVVVLRKKAVK